MSARLAAGLLPALVGACAGVYGGTPPVHHVAHAAVDITAAALPYAIVDARTGHAVDTAAFWTRLAAARAVCVGEEHSNPHHHWVELEIAKHLFASWRHAALGLEMIQRPFQGVLDDFATGRIDAAALRSRVGWDDRWGFDYAFYGPTLALAVAAHEAILALNAPKELTKQVAHHGIASLSPEDQAQVPELDLHDAAHRAWFDSLMEGMSGGHGHGGHTAAPPATPAASDGSAAGDGSDDAAEPMEEMPAMPSADDVYAVQVIWDETMADTAAKWLAAHPDGHIVILAGTGHCHDSAIVGRLKRRGVADAISIRSVVDTGEGDVADALAKPMNDYVVVLTPPTATEPAGDAAAK